MENVLDPVQPATGLRNRVQDQAERLTSSVSSLLSGGNSESELLEKFPRQQRRHTMSGHYNPCTERNITHDQAKNIVLDDDSFRQLKKDLKATKLVTTVGLSQVMKPYIDQRSKEVNDKRTNQCELLVLFPEKEEVNKKVQEEEKKWREEDLSSPTRIPRIVVTTDLRLADFVTA